MHTLRLFALASGHFPVCAVLSVDKGTFDCEVLHQLRLLERTRRAAVKGLKVQWQRFAQAGHGAQLGDSLKRVDPRGIWEFCRGDLRAIGFSDDGRIFLISTVLMKQTQKVDRQAVEKAVRVRDEYLRAKVSNQLVWGAPDVA